MAASEGEILDQVLPSLCQLLNVESIKPYLKSAGVLTETEGRELAAGHNNRREDEAKTLVTVLRTKGPQCANLLLAALRQSVSREGRRAHGHSQLVGILEDRLRKEGRLVEGSVLPQTQGRWSPVYS